MALTAKRVAFFDVDNTLMQGSSLFFLSRGMYQRGFFNRRDILAFLFANLRYQLTGKENKEEIDRVQQAACDFIKGHKVSEFENLAADVYDRYVSPALWQGTIEIAHDHLNAGEEVWLITASPSAMADFIAKKLGFTGALGTVAEVADGVYTGRLDGKLLHGQEKAVVVNKLALTHGIDLKNSYAYSDSHHDIPLLEAVGKPRVINPDTLLQVRALRDHWPIHDFRRARLVKKVVTPIISRLASLTTALNPRIRRKKL
jgi:HAD superfamily hydrolase (TIGR01490 family)